MGESTPPVVAIDGRIAPLSGMRAPVSGAFGCAYGIATPEQFEQACDLLRVDSLYFRDLRVADISALASVAGLRQLAIYFAPKVDSVSAVAELANLEVLALWETPAIETFGPLGQATGLRALQVSGGLNKPTRLHDLTFLSALDALTELRMHNIRVGEGGLRPIASCQSLETLSLSNQFPMEDYAFLSVRMPHTHCDLFAPYTRLNQALADGRDVMVTGARKPFLNSTTQGGQLGRYVSEFQTAQSTFRV